ncbi:MAG TPA: phosphoribosylamine--glycine ligase [Acidimicrobiia bacterium]|jgi:phosphoribosylamine--glycine ligase|nr:phosphoribosylamine--glycine ligase [Acidimicrobiia bacterium]
MRVLLVGSGGREHAIGWKLARSPRVDELISLPGNPGLAELGPTVEGIAVDDVGAIAAMARIHDVELVVVGPEAPLAAGLADAVCRLGIPVFGPTRAASRLESSKAFAKQVMTRAGVPTGSAARFEDADEAREHLDRQDGPFVVKADGLAGGKGVLVTESRRDAVSWVTHWIEQGPVVVEEYLEGPEVSVFAVCTESGAVALEPARDYKRLMEDDQGPNTGGMGAFSPVGDLPPGLVEETMTRVIHPTLNQMRADGNPFTGFLYAGLVLTDEGPKVLEFNVRLGDPETQVILPRLDSDLVDVLEGAPPVWSGRAAVNVVMAAKGYPTAPERGAEIRGLEGDSGEDVVVFHAGTAAEGKKLFVDGGRVLSVVGMGDTLGQARDRAYATADRITWPGVQYRRDIAG